MLRLEKLFCIDLTYLPLFLYRSLQKKLTPHLMDLEVLGSIGQINEEEAPLEQVEEEEAPPVMAKEAQPSILKEQSPSNIVTGLLSDLVAPKKR